MTERGPLRALDHLVLPCADLSASVRAYAELGFTVGRRNRHPWGTENHIIQFPTAFLELIAPAADAPPLSLEHEAFPFAGFLAGLGTSRDPSGMIVLRAADAAADAAAFEGAGLGTGRMLHFSRIGQAPDGTAQRVAFSLAFAEPPGMPDLGVFSCQHHHPEAFWDPAAQRHGNGATRIVAVVVAADRPARCAATLARLAGAQAVPTPEGRWECALEESCAIQVKPGSRAPRLVGVAFAGGSPTRDRRIDQVSLAFGRSAAT